MAGKKEKKAEKKGDETNEANLSSEQSQLDMSKQLDEITTALEKAKKLRNYFQTERDRVSKFWDISKKDLACAKFELRNADREIEELEEKHQVEMKVYKQKVRHLLYEQKVQLQELREKSEQQLGEAEKGHDGNVKKLKEQKKDLKAQYTEAQNGHVENITNERNMARSMLSTQQTQHDKFIQDMQQQYEEKLELLRDELELRRRAETHEIEERKNEHIKELVQKHKAAFQEIKEYYNDITSNNLDLIKSLKEEVANMKKNENYNIKLMYEIAQENKKLKDPLHKAEKEVESLRHQLANYEKDKLSLKNARSRLTVLESQHKTLVAEHDELKEEFSRTAEEKTELVTNFQDSLAAMNEVANRKHNTVDSRLSKLKEDMRAKDAQLGSV
ncbi:Growth arrest-specific protein 8, partial [Diplonema papillatum]